jgi:electron transport complex protein RnfB
VDAIIGSRNFTHTIIHDECVGCGLCLPPCPVDCIAIEPRFSGAPDDDEDQDMRRNTLRRLGKTAQRRFRARKARLAALGARAEARVSGAPAATAWAPTDDEIEALIRSLS